MNPTDPNAPAPTPSPWYVYILRCADGSLYSGVTTDLDRRVREHNAGAAGARYTRSRRPVEMAYSECLPDRARALRREYEVKQMDRAAKLRLLASGTPEAASPKPKSAEPASTEPASAELSSTATGFATFGLLAPLQRALAELEYRAPTPIQRRAIPPALAGRDLIAAARTGTGKTAAFALPLLHRLASGTAAGPRHIRALVLAPTRELAEQVGSDLKNYGRHLPLRIAIAYGGIALNPQMQALRRGADVLVATPGRLLDLHGKNALTFAALQILVLDEADRMLDLGFARDLREIIGLLPRRRQTLLFSATFSDPIRELATGLLHRPLEIDANPRNSAAETVNQWLIPVDRQRKLELFCHLLRKRHWPRVLVFAKTRKRVDELVTSLRYQSIAADAIHGDIAQSARLAALARFQSGATRVLVATDVAARGLDIHALPLVVNLDLPATPENYVHRIGRTARAGATGEAISLVSADEAVALTAIETLTGKPLKRREIAGFEPRHRVPATGPDKRPPTAAAMSKAAADAAVRKGRKQPRAAAGAAPKKSSKPGGGRGRQRTAPARKTRDAPG